MRTWVGGLKKDGPEQRNCSGLTTEAVCFADSVDFCTKKAEIRDLSLHGTRICGGFSWEPCHCGRSGQSSPALRRLTEHLPCLAGLVLTTKTRTRTTSVLQHFWDDLEYAGHSVCQHEDFHQPEIVSVRLKTV